MSSLNAFKREVREAIIQHITAIKNASPNVILSPALRMYLTLKFALIYKKIAEKYGLEPKKAVKIAWEVFEDVAQEML